MKRPTQLSILGLALVVMGLAFGNHFEGRPVAGVSSDLIVGGLFGFGIATLVLAVAEARKRRL